MAAPTLILALCAAALSGTSAPSSATHPIETPGHARDETDALIEANVRAATFAVQFATDGASVLRQLVSIQQRAAAMRAAGRLDDAHQTIRDIKGRR